MELPEKFSFRLKKDTGFTHSASVHGDKVKVKWARGWHEKRFAEAHFLGGDSLWTTADVEQAEMWVRNGGWIIVDEKKPQEEALPDFFLCTYDNREKPYNAEVIGDCVYVWQDGWETKIHYSVENFKALISKIGFRIIDKKPLTAEQHRANKEYREQIAALESSIKLNQQDIAHKERLIASYEERKSVLLKKIVEEL